MRKTTTTEIIIETDELFLITRPAGSIPGWCAECCGEVEMVTPEEAVAVTGVSARTIFKLVEAGQPHFTETPEGRLLVCPKFITKLNRTATPPMDGPQKESKR